LAVFRLSAVIDTRRADLDGAGAQGQDADRRIHPFR
jgi:hypothetical protein